MFYPIGSGESTDAKGNGGMEVSRWRRAPMLRAEACLLYPLLYSKHLLGPHKSSIILVE